MQGRNVTARSYPDRKTTKKGPELVPLTIANVAERNTEVHETQAFGRDDR
jgi:hypothetical protein